MSVVAGEESKIVLDYLQTSILFTDPKKPTGILRENQRFNNSKGEDVIVNSLGINERIVQEGVLNVNLFVPNLTHFRDGAYDYSQPNNDRLRELANLAKTALKKVKDPAGFYFFKIQQSRIMTDEGNNQHYVNIRVSFNSLNKPRT